MKKILVTLIGLFMIVGLTGCSEKKVDMSEYAYPTFNNIEEYGAVSGIKFDNEKISKKYEDLKDINSEDFEYSVVEKDGNGQNGKLKNGEMITLSIKYTGDKWKGYNFEGEFNYKVAGLKSLVGTWERLKDDTGHKGMKVKVIKTDNGYYAELTKVPKYFYDAGFRKGETKWKDIKRESIGSYTYKDLTSLGNYNDSRLTISKDGNTINIKSLVMDSAAGDIQKWKRID